MDLQTRGARSLKTHYLWEPLSSDITVTKRELKTAKRGWISRLLESARLRFVEVFVDNELNLSVLLLRGRKMFFLQLPWKLTAKFFKIFFYHNLSFEKGKTFHQISNRKWVGHTIFWSLIVAKPLNLKSQHFPYTFVFTLIGARGSYTGTIPIKPIWWTLFWGDFF